MFKPKRSHKRKRSSARADAARKRGSSRWNVQILPHTSRQAEKAPARNDTRLTRTTEQHVFNQSLELIMPLADDGNDEVEGRMSDTVQGLLARLEAAAENHKSYSAVVPLSLFLDPIFVTAYLRTGSLVALSYNPDRNEPENQEDDIICLDGQGTLVMSLCKDTYQTLGLTGRASHFSRKASGRAADRTSGSDTRFIVELPLLSPSFVPGKNGYQQAQRRLRAWDHARAQTRATTQSIPTTHLTGKIPATESVVDSTQATWNMLFVWSLSPETLASVDKPHELDTSMQFPDSLVNPKDVRLLPLHSDGPTTTDSVWVPDLSNPSHPLAQPWVEPTRQFSELEPLTRQNTWKNYSYSLQETVEWAGLVSFGSHIIRTFTKPDLTCVYSPPEGSRPGKVVRLSWSGGQQPLLLSASFIAYVSAQVDEYCQSGSNTERHNESWAILSCSGFPYAPLTWRSKVPLSRRFGLQPPSKNNAGDSQDDMSEMSLTDVEDDNMHVGSSEDSDSSTTRTPRKTSKRKKKSRRQIGKNETEHACTTSSGETGWIAFCLPTPPPGIKSQNTHWLLVERISTDTRS